MAEGQITQQLVDSETATPLTASVDNKLPASPASKAPKLGPPLNIMIPERDVGRMPTIIDDSPVAVDVPSPGAMSQGPRLYANPASREGSANQRKFGIKLH